MSAHISPSFTLPRPAARPVLGALALWVRALRTRRQMEALDDHLLRDLGLTRADVAREVMKAPWQA